MHLIIFVLSCFLFLPHFVKTQESSAHEYNPINFKNQIEEMDGNFVMFYAPWCKHCTEFQPIWSELAELVNTIDSKFAIAQVDCTLHFKLCHENEVTGYPTLLYFHRNTFPPVEYKGTRDLPSLTLFLSEVFSLKTEGKSDLDADEVNIYGAMAYLNDNNIERFLSTGQHFVMFYTSWCKASQKLAPIWSELAVYFKYNQFVQFGKVNCMENTLTCRNFDVKQYPYLLWITNGRIMGVADVYTSEELKGYVEAMMLSENHNPEKFIKKEKVLPVARISEKTFETFLEKELVFVNYFAPWCAHCMQLSPLWIKLGEKFQNESRVLIADVDCVQSKTICETERINGLPTLILYKQKMIVTVEHGGRPLESLIGLVKEHLEESTASPKPKETISESKQEETTKDEL